MAPLEDQQDTWSHPPTVIEYASVLRKLGHEEDLRGKYLFARYNSTSSSLNGSVYIGVGVGVGAAILAAMIFVLVKILQKRQQHKQAMGELDQQEVRQMSQHDVTMFSNIPQPENTPRTGGGRGGFFISSQLLKNGWGTLGSNEDMRGQFARGSATVPQAPLPHTSLVKKVKPRGIALKRLRHLSAIIESPRDSPEIEHRAVMTANTESQQQKQQEMARQPNNTSSQQTQPTSKAARKSEDIFRSNSRMAARSSTNASFVLNVPTKPIHSNFYENVHSSTRVAIPAPRSKSTGSLALLRNSSTLIRKPPNFQHPCSHTRSISLGSRPPSRPPSAAVPPLPIVGPHSLSNNDLIQQAASGAARGRSRSISSASSAVSASSSVLAPSPLMRVHHQRHPISSPNIEEAVAEDGEAQLKQGPDASWSKSENGSKRKPEVCHREKPSLTGSIHDDDRARRYSADNGSVLCERRSSNGSVTSITSPAGKRRRISGGASGGSNNSRTGIPRLSTPRRGSRGTSVSECGSPAERKRSSVLRDISGNSLVPSRQASVRTQSSDSSKGNPFQWDPQPMSKPSALKGSPNARRGHRRQNCVRISTLSPQVLGPPSSRLSSPRATPTIVEESGDGDYFGVTEGRNSITNGFAAAARRRSSASVPNLRKQTLRSSLTPSSPTLTAWIAYRDHGLLPSEHSDSNISELTGSARPGSRQSNRSSLLNIPSFPSPGKITVASPAPQREQGSLLVDGEMQSSPPASGNLYDPAVSWQIISEPHGDEYDPASPTYPFPRPVPSSSPQPSSLLKGHVDYGHHLLMPPTNASSRSPKQHQAENPNFPGAPILLPPETVFSMPSSPTTRTNLPPFSMSHFHATLRETPSPPSSPQRTGHDQDDRDDVSSSCVPSPLNIAPKASEQEEMRASRDLSPRGPRSAPAKTVLQNAMALRRMNSEAERHKDRESRRYIRLGREKSLELPFWASQEGVELEVDESCNDLFDFAFASGETDGPSAKTQSKASADDMRKNGWRRSQATYIDADSLDGSSDEDEQRRGRGHAITSSTAIPPVPPLPSNSHLLKETIAKGKNDEKPEELPLTAAQQQDQLDSIGVAISSSLLDNSNTTPKSMKQQQSQQLASSVQATPQSLYDHNGFLRA